MPRPQVKEKTQRFQKKINPCFPSLVTGRFAPKLFTPETEMELNALARATCQKQLRDTSEADWCTFFAGGTLRLHSGCKINLFLRLTGVLPDGYHTLETFFIPLSEPHDELYISLDVESTQTATSVASLAFTSQSIGQSSGKSSDQSAEIDPLNNTLQKVFAVYCQARGEQAARLPTLRLHLKKGVPQGAGLGGGSANAAVFLLFLESLALRLGLTPLEGGLNPLALRVGADVPFFLQESPALASGIGEALTLAPNPCAGLFLLLVWPAVSVSTPWAYKAWDAWQEQHKNSYVSRTDKVTGSCFTSDDRITGLTKLGNPGSTTNLRGLDLRNDLEAPVMSAFPLLESVKRVLLDKGAVVALMSGSGGALFGLFESEETAQAAFVEIKAKYPSSWLQRL